MSKPTQRAAPPVRLVSMKDVCVMTSVSRATIYSLIHAGSFPKPMRIGKRRVAWREAEVVAWLEARQPVTWAA